MFPKCSDFPFCRFEFVALGDRSQLEHHAEVLMHDFAACLLMELQQGMLNLSVGMMSLTTIIDQPDIFGYKNATDEITKRLGPEEARPHTTAHGI